MRFRSPLLWLICALALPAHAAPRTCLVVGVTDGDRLTVRCDSSGGGLFELQDAAREQRLGLWQDADPTPPWDWRQKQRERRWDDALF